MDVRRILAPRCLQANLLTVSDVHHATCHATMAIGKQNLDIQKTGRLTVHVILTEKKREPGCEMVCQRFSGLNNEHQRTKVVTRQVGTQ